MQGFHQFAVLINVFAHVRVGDCHPVLALVQVISQYQKALLRGGSKAQGFAVPVRQVSIIEAHPVQSVKNFFRFHIHHHNERKGDCQS